MFLLRHVFMKGRLSLEMRQTLASKPDCSIPSLVIASRKENRDDLILHLKQTDLLVAIHWE